MIKSGKAIWQIAQKRFHIFSLKNTIKLEKDKHQIKSAKHRIALARFRLSDHPLMIEKRRHMRPRIERSERKCFL